MGTKLPEYTLPPANGAKPKRSQSKLKLLGVVLLSIIWASLSLFRRRGVVHIRGRNDVSLLTSPGCPQVDVLVPEKNANIWKTAGQTIATQEFKLRAASLLGGAVQIPGETFDDMGPIGEDSRWEIHGKFHEYLAEAFPLVHATFVLEKVNTYGLLYTWKGSDASLKPLLLLAHQDVVPVDPNTVNEWAHPPFSGHFDGDRIWGRGSSDDKSGLIGILSSLQVLLENDFKSTRTIILAFGFDEEVGGLQGAGYIAPKILETYGEDSLALLVDEGGGFGQEYGTVFATPGVAEKGSTNVRVDIATPGGHSSVPPAHTSIGILARLLVEFENNPYEVHLQRGTPTYELFQCFAEYSKDIPDKLRNDIKQSAKSDKALLNVEDVLFQDPLYKSLVETTQAIDIIHGGVKSNALPEQAWAIINHRISTQSSASETFEHDTHLLISLAERFNLTYTAFGKDISQSGVPTKGSLALSSPGYLDIAPLTPTTGNEAAPYKLLSGTIKATYNAYRSLEGDNIVVGPGMPTGNTDTKYYWNLTPHIFRYKHQNSGNGTNSLGGGAHTVNESISADSFVEMILFYTTLILNVDETTDL
ncbi:carboxypeptidase S [Armillaria solidipes]|uniref:Carboxypeptidase S n=1 Tax=Armillaria solidipes TaxID=1076256 RepID=A0A2H3BZ21_9AGAR|nr:carboxypeptidase S [Armillaria solidipes]